MLSIFKKKIILEFQNTEQEPWAFPCPDQSILPQVSQSTSDNWDAAFLRFSSFFFFFPFCYLFDAPSRHQDYKTG